MQEKPKGKNVAVMIAKCLCMQFCIPILFPGSQKLSNAGEPEIKHQSGCVSITCSQHWGGSQEG